MKNILLIFSLILSISCGNSKEEAEKEKLKAGIEAREKELERLREEDEKIKAKNEFMLELVKAGKTAEEAQKIADSLHGIYKQ